MEKQPIGPNLFVVTGFPTSNFSKLRSELSKAPFRKAGTFLCIPARDSGIIYNPKYLNQIEQALADQINKKAPNNLPERLTIFHLEDPNEKQLFKRCHLYASLRKVEAPATHDWKFKVPLALQAIKDSIPKDYDEPYSKYSPLLLPPQNFACKNSTLEKLLFEFSQGTINATHVSRHVDSKCFNSGDLPKAICGGKHYICTDKRGLAFPPCKKHESHGISRSRMTNGHFLSGHYRFGIKLENGFHFDAQFPKRENIKGVSFKCSVLGDFTAQAKHSHANIYPNDFVRLGEK